MPEIRPLTAADVRPLRQLLLRPQMRAEDIVLPGDDAPETYHPGLFDGGELIGIASLYHAASPHRPEIAGAWQLRMLGVVPARQGQGLAREIVLHCIDHARSAGGRLIWGNARVHRAGLYAKLGFIERGEPFDVPGVCMHIYMERELEPA